MQSNLNLKLIPKLIHCIILFFLSSCGNNHNSCNQKNSLSNYRHQKFATHKVFSLVEDSLSNSALRVTYVYEWSKIIILLTQEKEIIIADTLIYELCDFDTSFINSKRIITEKTKSNYFLKDSLLLFTVPFKFEEYKMMSLKIQLSKKQIEYCGDINFIDEIKYNSLSNNLTYKYKSMDSLGIHTKEEIVSINDLCVVP